VTGTVETDLVLSRRHGGSDTLYASFYGCVKEFELPETIWRENIPQSVAVSSSGTVWGNSIIRALSSESGCITPFRIFGIGAVHFIFPFDYAERSERAKKAIALLDQWMNDDSGYDEETWPELKKSLDRERLSHRRLFDAESDPS
jgi:hypothetical protein